MKYLIDKTSGDVGDNHDHGGVPSGNGGGPTGGPPDKGGGLNLSSSSSSSSINSLKTSKKNREDYGGVVDLLKVIASQDVGGKDKAK